ncbi:phage integrase N-terminal SAM-like domain-containing protein [Microcoleus sp. bin38.metabat.b11b12b14.051]|uniref:phage integrase N-terminal SAM-like domain-containing protein n=1 Tax=Microcoleus sp. bin38.metabat.b11b12b14.051 TaxID=2742709 RepID=UPI00345793DC
MRADLSYLATDLKIAPSTQNIALSALLFLYRQVLRVDFPNIKNIERARQTRHLPVVLTREEVKNLLSNDDLYSCIKSRWTGCDKST